MKTFYVLAFYPCDSIEQYEQGDEKLFAAAGQTSQWSGTGFGERDHGWQFHDKKDADELYFKLIALTPDFPGFRVERKQEIVEGEEQ